MADSVKWFPNPKGGESRLGEKGDWKNVEGEVVISDVDANSPEEFAEKSRAIKVLWPTAVIRFMKPTKAV